VRQVRGITISKIKNELPIKFCKAKEGLNLPDLPRFRPILKNFYFAGSVKRPSRVRMYID
jgi:hypothetical protein